MRLYHHLLGPCYYCPKHVISIYDLVVFHQANFEKIKTTVTLKNFPKNRGKNEEYVSSSTTYILGISIVYSGWPNIGNDHCLRILWNGGSRRTCAGIFREANDQWDEMGMAQCMGPMGPVWDLSKRSEIWNPSKWGKAGKTRNFRKHNTWKNPMNSRKSLIHSFQYTWNPSLENAVQKNGSEVLEPKEVKFCNLHSFLGAKQPRLIFESGDPMRSRIHSLNLKVLRRSFLQAVSFHLKTLKIQFLQHNLVRL